ncbi:redoxin domain-containing protein, partial [Gammaproteobacteria bacterium]|nr:redoxin domain-containing protein [Gammaproteobacteria bacterium]
MFRYLSIIICSTLLFWSCQSKHKHTQQCSCGEDHSEFFKEKEAPKPDKQGYIVKIGEDAPNFKIPLASGAIFELAQQKGKVVMLQFTASWCGVCRKEMPYIEKEIYQVHKENKEFVLMGIDVDE